MTTLTTILELLLNRHQVDIATQSVIGNRNRV